MTDKKTEAEPEPKAATDKRWPHWRKLMSSTIIVFASGLGAVVWLDAGVDLGWKSMITIAALGLIAQVIANPMAQARPPK